MTEPTPQTEPVEPQPQQAEVAPTADEREDAYLMQIDGDDADESAPVAETDAAEAPQASEPQEQTTSESDTGDLEEAWSVLRRDGFSKDDLAALSDDAIARLAAHRKKVQTDVDRMLSDAKGANEAQPEQSPEEPSEPTTAEAAQGQPVGDNLLQAAKAFADHVGLDDEGAQILAKSYESLIQPFQQQLAAMQQQMAAAQLDSARSRLVGKYPQVADTKSEEWGRVVARMNKMYSDSDSYDTVEALMEDAIAFEFRDQIRAEAESAQTSLRNLRQNGVVSKPAGAQPSGTEPSADEIEDQILALLESDAPDRMERARMLGRR